MIKIVEMGRVLEIRLSGFFGSIIEVRKK